MAKLGGEGVRGPSQAPSSRAKGKSQTRREHQAEAAAAVALRRRERERTQAERIQLKLAGIESAGERCGVSGRWRRECETGHALRPP